ALGWYLMMVQPGPDWDDSLSFNAPVDSFDRAAECKRAAAELLASKVDCDKLAAGYVQMLRQDAANPNRVSTWNAAAEAVKECQSNAKPLCIATDDPRLKLGN